MASPFTLSFFAFSLKAAHPACVTTTLALTFSHSKVFTYQLPTDTLPLVTAGAHKREQTITTVKAPLQEETHYNPGRHEKEGCGKSLY